MKRTCMLVCAGLVLCCAAIYGRTLAHDFVNYDDCLYVTDNAEVQAGLTWTNVLWSFTTDRAKYMHPLTWMSHMLDCSLYGMRPWGHHATNLVLHSLDAALLFLVFLRMTRRLWPSALVAALFAVHPLHVESVAWIAERKDVLSMFFWTLGLGAYALHREKPGYLRYAAVTAMFLLGLMSKPMVVTFPCVLLLLDYWPLGRIDGAVPAGKTAGRALRLSVEKAPLFLIAAAASAVTMLMQMRGNNLSFGDRIPLLSRCANAVVVYALYLAKTVWPFGLAVYYPHPIHRPSWQVALAAAALLAITAVAVREMRRRPWLIVGWLWYLGTLFPVIEIIQAGSFSHADRYTYIPLIGVFIMLAFELDNLPADNRALRAAAAASSVLWVALLAGVAFHQTGYWRNSETLFRHALAVTPDNPESRKNLGGALYADRRLDEAYAQFERALELNPADAMAMHRMGVVLYEQGRTEESLAMQRRALAADPTLELARVRLKLELKKLGRLDAAEADFARLSAKEPKSLDDYCRLGSLAVTLGQPQAAAAAFDQAFKIDPDGRQTNSTLGDVFTEEGRFQEALEYYGRALKADPSSVQTIYNLGAVLSKLGRTAEAADRYREAIRLKPDFAQAYNNLGSLLANAQRLDEAVEQYRRAVAIDPKYAQACANLASLLDFQGKSQEALAAWERAVLGAPENMELRLALAEALLRAGRAQEAGEQAERVLETQPRNESAVKLRERAKAGVPAASPGKEAPQ